ncbi:MAG: Na+ dependent nucleoside transporter N-terminal domain-containing protein, partial [Fulvivirga sp.]|nr:Na+ dependent nucleoside transporter N-terminal domain-containing protein [Fulvivirga sp.]
MDILRGVIGLGVLVGIAYLVSRNKKAIDWRLVGIGILLQIIFAVLITKVDFVAEAFNWISEKFVIFLSFSEDGAEFLF